MVPRHPPVPPHERDFGRYAPEIPPHEEILRKLDEVLDRLVRIEDELRRLAK